MSETARVVIIGGGVVGASVLYHLAKAGWTDSLLIERSELTSGSTWHAAGGFHTLNGDTNMAALQGYTIRLYKELEEITGMSCGLHHVGGITLADNRDRFDMLLAERASLGVDVVVSDEKIQVTGALQKQGQLLSVESDWSGASYWYSMVALTPDMSLKLRYLNQDSRQGDSAIADLFQRLGVMTEFDVEQQSVLLRATNQPLPDYVSWDLSDTPDIAQTIAVCCFALGVRCHLSGLHTLKIKETDRLEALTVELSKLGAMVVCNEYSISIEARKEPIKPNISIKTYNDHRMAMAFAPLVSRVPIYIEDHGVVSKSYPNFWKDMANVGLEYSLGN